MSAISVESLKRDSNSYEIVYRNIKNPRLEFKTGKLIAIVPPDYNCDSLISKYCKWIEDKEDFIQECRNNSAKVILQNRSLKEFRKFITDYISAQPEIKKYKTLRISLRTMKTKWASIKEEKEKIEKLYISINKKMQYLPDYLIRYIIFHETAHLKQKKHNGRFWNIIQNEYKNYREFEKELFVFWFKIEEHQNLKTSIDSKSVL